MAYWRTPWASLGPKSPQKQRELQEKQAPANTEEEAGDSMYAEIGSAGAGNLSMCTIADALRKVSEKLNHNCDLPTVTESGTSSHNIAPELPPRVNTYGSNPHLQAAAPASQAPEGEGSYYTLKPNEVQKAEKATEEVLNLLNRAKEINETASEALKELQKALNDLDAVKEGKKAPQEFITTAIQTLYKAEQAKNEAEEIASMNIEKQTNTAKTELRTYEKNSENEQQYIEEIESYISTIKLKQTELESEQELATENISKIETEIQKTEPIKNRFITQFNDVKHDYMTAEAVPQLLQANALDTALTGAAPLQQQQPPAKSAGTIAETAFKGGGSRKLTKKIKTKKGKKSRKSTKKGKSRKSKLAKQKYKKGKKSKMRKKYNKKTKRVTNNNTNTKK